MRMNLYNVYFTSKGTGPQTVQIEALNRAGSARRASIFSIRRAPSSALKSRVGWISARFRAVATKKREHIGQRHSRIAAPYGEAKNF